MELIYHYDECKRILEEKYSWKERDFAGKYTFLEKAKQETYEKFKIDSWYYKSPSEYGPGEALAFEYYNNLLKNVPPYLDFWHWVVDNYQISNGCYITFSFAKLEEIQESWVAAIYATYINNFADKNGNLTMWVGW